LAVLADNNFTGQSQSTEAAVITDNNFTGQSQPTVPPTYSRWSAMLSHIGALRK